MRFFIPTIIAVFLSSCASEDSSTISFIPGGGESEITGMRGDLFYYENEERGEEVSHQTVEEKTVYEVVNGDLYILNIEPIWSDGREVGIMGDGAEFEDHSFCQISYWGKLNSETSYLLTFLEVGEFELSFTVRGITSSTLFKCK